MAAVKITNFLGTAPKISPELLPNTASQTANNCKLYSGDLIPYPQPVVVANTNRTGTIKTLFALRDPDTDALKWLSWLTDVDIAVASANEDGEQRFYYTGDGAPKVSTYDLATIGTPPYPINYYDLGLPVPPDSAQLTTTAATFTQKTSSTIARDAGNIVTLVTSAAHELRTGNIITVSGFSYRTGTYSQSGTTITVTINGHGLSNGASITLDFTSGTATDGTFTISGVTTNTFTVTASASASTSGNVSWDIRGFNAVNVECTVVNSTTFTYFSPGPQNTVVSLSTGKVDLGGLTQVRSYVFTWMTPWEEESIASKPSANLYIKEGIIVTVSNFPTVKPTGNNFVRGVRLYRTLASASGTEYYRLATLWFPTALSRVERTTNVSKVTTLYPHNFAIDDRFKISGCTDSTFNITGGIVTDVIDAYTFEYAQTAADVADTAVAAGTLYHDVSEDPPTSTARYWGDGSYDFTDDFDSKSLFDILGSDEYDAPPEELKGLTSAQNNILVGFVKNQLYFSEPGVPHAWPARYAVTLPYDIIGIAAISGSMLVTTESYPYIVSGSDPAAGMSVSRIDALYPCLNAKSMVTMGYGIVYSTHDGLALFSPGSGPNIITKLLYNNDTWETALNPATLIAEYYGDNYVASHSGGGLVFERDEKVGGFFVDTDYTFTASWYDSITGKLYYVYGTNGDIYEWNDLAQPMVTQTWKSKVINTKDMINMGAARIIADYGDTTGVWNEVTTTWDADIDTWDAPDALTFKLWVNKELIHTTVVNDDLTFRLPTGYRSDTFEVEVSGNIRVRAIHLGETPLSLREA
jgi:hypothetical protein